MKNQIMFEGQIISEQEAIRIVKDYPRDLSRIKNQTEKIFRSSKAK